MILRMLGLSSATSTRIGSLVNWGNSIGADEDIPPYITLKGQTPYIRENS